MLTTLFLIACTVTAQYDSKMRTRFDGVTTDTVVDYLILDRQGSVSLPLSHASVKDAPVDFTFKFWFKTTGVQR
jgi:hypothetical protein